MAATAVLALDLSATELAPAPPAADCSAFADRRPSCFDERADDWSLTCFDDDDDDDGEALEIRGMDFSADARDDPLGGATVAGDFVPREDDSVDGSCGLEDADTGLAADGVANTDANNGLPSPAARPGYKAAAAGDSAN